uniref:AT23209p n=1 Tax=Drosophila melanogaster TaxID=7227 RepID=Q8T8V0_DROME|nr:AT23209p [Drosophila melanogaster]
MADAIRCACESLNSALGYLVTMRISEVRHCFELLGVAHVEVLAGVIVFILMQFTKFTAVLMLAILLAYGIFYLWDTFFPEISHLGRRGMKMFRNVRTSANLPPFASDTEETPGEYQIRPRSQHHTTGMITPPNTINMPMLLPMVQTNNLRTTSLQTDRRRQEEENRRGSRGGGHSAHQESRDTDRKHRRERPNWRSVHSDIEREQPSTSKKAHHGSSGGGESRRMSNVVKTPTITSGMVDTRRLSNVTRDQLKRLPNITSGESRRTAKEAGGANNFKKLHHITSGELTESRRIPRITSNTTESRWLPRGEMKESRRIQQITSNTNESRRLPTVTSGEVKESRRSSHPHGGGEYRRTSNNQRDGGGGGESRSRRSAEKSNPAQSRRHEEQSKQRRSSNGHPGVTKRQFPDDHFERLKLENREFQARRLQESGAAFRQSLSNPTSEGALLTKQENFIENHRQYDRRDVPRNIKPNNPNKDASHRNRTHNRMVNPIL